MKWNNQTIAEQLYKFSDLLEASGDNPYRIRAYRRAARSVINLKTDLCELLNTNDDLTAIPWIGEGIAVIVKNMVLNNQLPVIKPKQPPRKIETAKKGRFLRLYHALMMVPAILAKLKEVAEIKKIECVSEFRRKNELVDQLEFLISASDSEKVIKHFLRVGEVKYILHQDKNTLEVLLWSGVKVYFYFVPNISFGAALLHYTGNAKHIEKLAQLAKNKKLLLNKRGLFKDKTRVANTEAEIYQHLKLQYIEPELREDRGEIVAAKKHQLPELITLADMKGDLHSHTNETDGKETLENMVKAASERGYEYLAITDHSKRLVITNGMDEKRLLKQIEKIDALNAKLKNILILKSIEVDILEDGNLDLSNEVLKELDIVVCSIHSKFRLDEKVQTKRIIKAMQNPYFNILGHATGRLIKSRAPYPINLKEILKVAKDNNCFIELNSQPYRLDINDVYCKLAKEQGVKMSISSDAHSIRELNFMPLGIYQARRGWLTKEDVINTRSWPELKKLIKKR